MMMIAALKFLRHSLVLNFTLMQNMAGDFGVENFNIIISLYTLPKQKEKKRALISGRTKRSVR